jgi:hypothetical protein
MHERITDKASLDSEYNDLEEEYWQCDSRAERQRCSQRMNEIIAEEDKLARDH